MFLFLLVPSFHLRGSSQPLEERVDDFPRFSNPTLPWFYSKGKHEGEHYLAAYRWKYLWWHHIGLFQQWILNSKLELNMSFSRLSQNNVSEKNGRDYVRHSKQWCMCPKNKLIIINFWIYSMESVEFKAELTVLKL